MQVYENQMSNSASGRIVDYEPVTETTSRLYLDSGFSVEIQGRIKDLRAIYHGDKIDGFYVYCNRKMQMTPEHWEQIQPLLIKENFTPSIEDRLKLTYQDLEALPRLLWTTDMGRATRKEQIGVIYLYHPINFWKSSYDPKNPEESIIKGNLKDFHDGKTDHWSVTVNLETNSLKIHHEIFDGYRYLV